MREGIKDPADPLEGKEALIVGIDNDQSIAYGCALAFRACGAGIAMTYLNDKTKSNTQPLAQHLGVDPEPYLPRNVRTEGQFEAIDKAWAKLDIALRSIAFAPRDDLHRRVTNCSREGFLMAMDVTCHFFIRMARLTEPPLKNGRVPFTMSYYGAE